MPKIMTYEDQCKIEAFNILKAKKVNIEEEITKRDDYDEYIDSVSVEWCIAHNMLLDEEEWVFLKEMLEE